MDTSIIVLLARTWSVLVIAVVFILSFFSDKLRWTKRQCRVAIFFFALAFAVLGFFNTEVYRTDFDWYRHSYYMDQIRTSNMSLIDFLFHNRHSVGGGGYIDLYAFNFIRWVITKITTHNELICAVFDFAFYSIWGYIMIDWHKETKGYYGIDFFTLLMSQTFLPYLLFSGNVRFGMCTALMGLGTYLYLFKKKKLYIFCLITFIAATIHPAAFITVILVILAKRKLGLKGHLMVFSIGFIAQIVADLWINSKIHYLWLLAYKYQAYTSEEQYRSSRSTLYTVILIAAVMLIIYFLAHFKSIPNETLGRRQSIYDFLVYDMLFVLGNIGNYDMVIRPAAILGILSAVLCSFTLDDALWKNCRLVKKNQRVIKMAAQNMCIILGIYLNVKLIMAYGMYYF